VLESEARPVCPEVEFGGLHVRPRCTVAAMSAMRGRCVELPPLTNPS
jgi:hypothetical protein